MSKSLLFMLVIDGKTGRSKKVQYIWEPGVSPEEDAKMDRIIKQVRECVNGIHKWMVMDDYEKGIYHIYDDTGHNRIGICSQNPVTKFAYDGDYHPSTEEKWWNETVTGRNQLVTECNRLK